MSNPSHQKSDQEFVEWILRNQQDKIQEAEQFFWRMWNGRPANKNFSYDDLWSAFEVMLDKPPYSQLDDTAKTVLKLVHRIAWMFLKERLKAELA